jgi:hypothetical protein
MRTKVLLFLSIFVLSCYSYKAQNHERDKWFPVLISVHGTVAHYGVKANAMITKCNGQDVMLLELVNTNAYPVKCEWLHAPIDKQGKQHYKDELQTLNLKASETSTGKCDGPKQLIIKLSDYNVTVEDLADYYGATFTVTKQ